MALKGDQRALLQLLCERGQSYEDLSGLLGISEDEVRNRARASLQELGGADPDAEVGLTDYLLGQADPIGRADAVRYLQGDPETLALASRIEAQLAEIAPQATLPKLPEPRGKRRRAATPGPGEEVAEPSAPTRSAGSVAGSTPASAREGKPRGGMDARQQRLIAALAAAAVVLLFIILAVAGVFGGADESTAPTTSVGGSTTPPTEDTRNITSVELAATNDSGVVGTTLFGLVADQQLYVDVDLQGLDPTPPKDSTYFIWLMVGDTAGYPINNPTQSPIAPDQNGAYSGRIAVPGPIAVSVGGKATSVRVSTSDVPELAAAAKKAARKNALTLPFVGTELASGEIPLAADNTGGATAPTPGSGSTAPGGSGG